MDDYIPPQPSQVLATRPSKSTTIENLHTTSQTQLHPQTQAQSQPLPQQRPLQRETEMHIMSKNARGLGSDDRLDELVLEAELLPYEWDFIMVSETWRLPVREYFEIRGGHRFAGGGHASGRRGVAFLINRKWTAHVKEFTVVNERVAYLLVRKRNIRLRLVVAYFPHSGYIDAEVQKMYTLLSSLRHEAHKNKEMFFLAGDFNAEVGSRLDQDHPATIGDFGLNMENSRGQWLKQWCTQQDLSIANTFFSKRPEFRTTHVGPSKRPRQIDYIIVDRSHKQKIRDCSSTSSIDLGSDHKTVYARLKFQQSLKPPSTPVASASKCNIKWSQVDTTTYLEHLTQALGDIRLKDDIDQRCQQIEEALLIATNLSQAACTQQAAHNNDNTNMHELMAQRRDTPHHCTQQRACLSKSIQKEIKAIKRAQRRERIAKILHEFQGLKHIAGVKSRKRRALITHMTDEHGQDQTERTSIANVFADFYADLYKTRLPTNTTPPDDIPQVSAFPPFTQTELLKQLRSLKGRRCKDSAGIIGEMLKAGGSALLDVLLDTYNKICSPSAPLPSKWRTSVISVLFKSGDARRPENYRPITVIPLLYKLFAKLLYARLQPILDRHQCADQAGFRNEFSTEDHLYTFSLLSEKAYEHQVNLWVAAVDFAKAFDSIEHSGLWQALSAQGVPKPYINLLQNLYSNQTARVRTDVFSKCFSIQRGTKQGDPLSTLLFNSILEHAMRPIKQQWMEKKLGIIVGATAENRLTNLRFADDILLIARSRNHLSQMLRDLNSSVSHFGLKLHPEKTKVLTNAVKQTGRGRDHSMTAGDLTVEILPLEATVKYLGRHITFDKPMQSEIAHRVRCAWAKFSSYKQELTNKHYSLRDRLKLFDSVVTPTMLYGSSSWVLTKETEHILTRTQRRMLRMVLGSSRRRQLTEPEPESASSHGVDSQCEEEVANDNADEDDHLEPWVDWLKRTTHYIEDQLTHLNIESWVHQARRRIWNWAQRVANQPPDRWANQLINWQPHLHFEGTVRRHGRRQARPRARWDDNISSFLKKCVGEECAWTMLAKDTAQWSNLADQFVDDAWRMSQDTLA